MSNRREELRRLVDELPETALQHAKTALLYCANPEEHRMTIEKAKERAKQSLGRHLRRHSERTGGGVIAVGGGGGHTFADGSHHTSMAVFVDGKTATYHLYIHRGVIFEVIETITISDDGQRIIRGERIRGADGSEQNLTAELPVLPRDDGTLADL
jgi:hypothetical protein